MTNNMTKKMPVVGKKYRCKETGDHFELTKCSQKYNGALQIQLRITDTENFSGNYSGVLSIFNQRFEELPDSNPQKVEENCPFETAAEEWNTTEVKEVSEVERALEELKRELRFQEYGVGGSFAEHFRKNLFKLSKNFINALEAERPLKFPKLNAWVKKNFPEDDISKPEPEIDMKEEHVEPVSIERESIWNCFSDDFIYNSGFTPEQILVFEVIFNSFEQMQKDIEELKRR